MRFQYTSGYSLALTGKSHLQVDKPCQDYAKYDHKNGIQVVALADGAGSSDHSQIGSRISVDVVCDLLLSRYSDLHSLSTSEISNTVVTEVLAVLTCEAEKNGLELTDLASTLLFAATDGNSLLYGHIGDGYIIRVVGNDSAEVLSYPVNGEFANQTYFVTSPGAINLFNIDIIPMHRESVIFLMSDGPSSVLFQRRPFAISSVFLDMSKWISNNKTDIAYAAILQNFEDSVTVRVDDDCSLALLYSSSIMYDEFSDNAISKLDESLQQVSFSIPLDVILDFLNQCMLSKRDPLKIECTTGKVQGYRTKNICQALTALGMFEDKDGNKIVFCKAIALKRLFF